MSRQQKGGVLLEKILAGYAPQAYAAMRIIFGLLFLCHGLQKVFGLFGGVNGAAAPLFSLLGIAGVIELVTGALIAVGFVAGTAAFIASGQMAVAYFAGHFPAGSWPIQNDGELSVLYCFVFLYMATRGSGIWSVDAARTGGSAV
jgi:putative oxidoreductase